MLPSCTPKSATQEHEERGDTLLVHAYPSEQKDEETEDTPPAA